MIVGLLVLPLQVRPLTVRGKGVRELVYVMYALAPGLLALIEIWTLRTLAVDPVLPAVVAGVMALLVAPRIPPLVVTVLTDYATVAAVRDIFRVIGSGVVLRAGPRRRSR